MLYKGQYVIIIPYSTKGDAVMQRGTLIWGAILFGGAIIMAILGFSYSYLSKWDKMKVHTIDWDEPHKPIIKIRERFNLRLPVLIDCFIAMFASLAMLFGNVLGPILDQNPWYLNILVLILFIFGHFLIWALLMVVCTVASITKNHFIKNMYSKKADIVDTTVFGEFEKDN